MSVLKWHGGKHYLADKIIALMGEHLHYVEPYAGGLSVLLAKDPIGYSEVVNDLDEDVSNFWAVLADPLLFDQFLRRSEATIFSQVAWEDARVLLRSAAMNRQRSIRAWAFFVLCRQSLAGRMKVFSPLSKRRIRRGMNEQASAWWTAIDGLEDVHARLARVVVLNDEATEVIRKQDGRDTLFYLDPPYVPTTRASRDVYKHEMSLDQHEYMLHVACNLKGKCIISGYDSEMYNRKLNQWYKFVFPTPNNAAGGDEKRTMAECVWLNYSPPKGKL